MCLQSVLEKKHGLPRVAISQRMTPYDHLEQMFIMTLLLQNFFQFALKKYNQNFSLSSIFIHVNILGDVIAAVLVLCLLHSIALLG